MRRECRFLGRLAAWRAEPVDRASYPVDTATERVELPVGLEPLTRCQPFAEHSHLFVLVALIEAAACNRLIAQLLKKRRDSFNPDAPPIRGQSAPSRHRQAVTRSSFDQNLIEAGCQLFIAHGHNFHELAVNDC